jgi:hypothetical protein
MSNVTLNNLPISDFIGTATHTKSPIKLVVNDVLFLSNPEIDFLVTMIQSVKGLDKKEAIEFSIDSSEILKQRPSKELDKAH